MVAPLSFRAFVDESSALRTADKQEYLIGAALIPSTACDAIREQLRGLLLPGQIKVHWTDESESRRRRIVHRIAQIQPVNVIISHVTTRQPKTERSRRKCLEDLYHELIGMQVDDLTLESRSSVQDARDRAHIVALQSQGLSRSVRISHLRGGEEPLLWISDAVLGAINAAELGAPEHLEALEATLMIRRRTAESLPL